MKNNSTWYFETLTVRTWLLRIFPKLVRARLAGHPVARSQVFDASPIAFQLAKAMSWMAATSVGRVQFRIMDIRDENGVLVRLRVTYFDLTEVQREILNDADFKKFVKGQAKRNRFAFY